MTQRLVADIEARKLRLLNELKEQSERKINVDDPRLRDITSAHSQGEGYIASLRELLQALQSFEHDSAETDWSNVRLKDVTLLWKVPSFCQPHLGVLEPSFLRQHIKYLGNIQTDPTQAYRDDIWGYPQVSSWIGSGRSSILLLQSGYESKVRSGLFGAELSDHIEENKLPIAYMVYKPAFPGAFNLPFQIEEVQVLRHLAIQALRVITDQNSIRLLADIVEGFSRATAASDWFKILHEIFSFVSELYVIVDLGIHASSADAARTWPHKFDDLLNDLRNSSPNTIIRVMLIACRPLDLPQDSVGVSKVVIRRPNVHPDLIRIRHSKEAKIPPNLWEHYKPPTSVRMAKNEPQINSREGLNMPSIAQTATSPAEDTAWSNQLGSIHGEAARQWDAEKPKHAQEFEIAIFCALTLEADAILSLFDTHWDQAGYPKAAGDKNWYSLGTIGRHKVVLVHMPGMGKSKAATASSQCRTTFTSIKLSLLVGICGGVPFGQGQTVERLLGDVVISEGLVQYDFGRQYPGYFERKSAVQDSLAKPDAGISGFLSRLKTLRYSTLLLEDTYSYLAALQSCRDLDGSLKYTRPGLDKDCLYKPSYLHKHHEQTRCSSWEEGCKVPGGICKEAVDSNCDILACESDKLMPRQRIRLHESQGTKPDLAIHIGKMASADKVVKSGEERDRVAMEENIIAFEMEGAGLWDHGPCLVIKSICDYADCHKSKDWQAYASATAAACTKALLIQWD